jgi:hypothetical protein
VNPTFPLDSIAGIRIAINWSWLVIFQAASAESRQPLPLRPA